MNFLQVNYWDENRTEVCYIGGFNAIRGIPELVSAANFFSKGVRLSLAGSFEDPVFEKFTKASLGWNMVNDCGYLDRRGVIELLSRSIAGFVTLKPLPNYLVSYPVKMFEYMASGLPVIASRFPLWERIIEKNACGICVNPESPREIADAVNFLFKSQEQARLMGLSGRCAVINKYNWAVEEKKLLKLYRDLAI
jgi:glycosyltransferase involved in cell wall biosynthesis